MEERVRAYARLRLERAREELATARENIANMRFRAATSRAYYAVFYMASAALFSLEIERTKHSGVESAFSRYLVKRGLVEPEFGRIYYASRRQREEADYAEEWFIDEETVRRVVEDAVRFVDRIEAFLRESNSL